jgi:HEAT repeat protein
MPLLAMKDRKHKTAFLLGGAFIGVAVLPWAWISPWREPVYQDRPVRSWLADLGHGEDSEADLSQKALREMYRTDTPGWLRSAASWIELKSGIQLSLKSDRERWERTLASAMISLLSDADPAVRSGAARALEECTNEASRVAPALAIPIQDPDQRTRLWAVRSIGQMVSEQNTVIPVLIRALNDTDPNVRAYACIGLNRLGPAAADAIPALQAVIAKYPDDWSAAETLKLLAPESSGRMDAQ